MTHDLYEALRMARETTHKSVGVTVEINGGVTVECPCGLPVAKVEGVEAAVAVLLDIAAGNPIPEL